jgi:hypothetical protein
VLARGAGSFTLWHYGTEDNFPTILTPGYWYDTVALLRPGDVIIVSSTANGVAVVKSIYVERIAVNGPAVRLMSANRGLVGPAQEPRFDYTALRRDGDGADVTRAIALAPPPYNDNYD